MRDPKEEMTKEFATRILLSNLLDEIKDRSLQNILRQVIFHEGNNTPEKDIATIIREERPEIKWL